MATNTRPITQRRREAAEKIQCSSVTREKAAVAKAFIEKKYNKRKA